MILVYGFLLFVCCLPFAAVGLIALLWPRANDPRLKRNKLAAAEARRFQRELEMERKAIKRKEEQALERKRRAAEKEAAKKAKDERFDTTQREVISALKNFGATQSAAEAQAEALPKGMTLNDALRTVWAKARA